MSFPRLLFWRQLRNVDELKEALRRDELFGRVLGSMEIVVEEALAGAVVESAFTNKF